MKPGRNDLSPDELNRLVSLFNSKLYSELEKQARALIGRYPDSGFSWKLLGAALQMQGKDALSAFQKTASLLPKDADTHNNLGLALQNLGQLEGAVASYRRALEITPDSVVVNYNLGNALKDLGQVDKAVTCYRRALVIKPDFAEAHNNLGIVLRSLGQIEAAAASSRRALEIKPNLAEAHNNLGIALRILGQAENALSSYRRALAIKTDYAEAHNNLGIVLRDLSQYESSLASYQRALEIKPDYAEAHNNLGIVLHDISQHEDAVACCRRALEIKPDFLDALNNLLFFLNSSDKCSPSYYLEQAQKYGLLVTKKTRSRFSRWHCVPAPARLRVGLVSGDLRVHSVGLFLEGVLSHIDPARIELIAYPTYHKEDELTVRIKPYFSAWKPLVGKNDEDAAHLIHADGVHVLLDISGHSAHNRLPVFAWKPASVQATWLGLPTTTGVKEIDYILGDILSIPLEHENHFSEAVWRMPDSYVCFSAPAYPIDVAPLPALSTGRVTFGSFNNLTKMTDSVVELWARILMSVPDSRLYLKTGQLSNAGICEQTRYRFAKWNIAPERLLLGGKLGSIADHLAEYNKIDIALDTFPYPGVTTSIEALWMGVPVLSLAGDRFLSLTAKSIAYHAGLPDWIAADKDDYASKAIDFTSNLEHLAALRTGLRQQVLASPLFDARRFSRNFEDALWGMWHARGMQQT